MMKKKLPQAILVGFLASLAHVALADPASDAAAARARQIRADVEAKQKALADEKRVDAPAQPQEAGAPLDLPVDETDSPGATKQ